MMNMIWNSNRTRLSTLTTLTLLCGLAGGQAIAAPGDLDPSFGGQGGYTRTAATVSLPASRGMLRDTLGRLWVAGYTPVGTTQSQPLLMRYLSNGAVDTSFGNAGTWTPNNGVVTALADARVLRSGSVFYLITSSNSQITVFALDGNGLPVSTFGSNGRMSVSLTSAFGLIGAAMQGSQIVIAGNGRNPTTQNSDFLLIRVLSNGSLDTSFGTGGMSWSRIYTGATAMNRLTDVVIQPDAKIVAVGRAGPSVASSNAVVARFLAGNGVPDTSFAGSGFSEKSWGGVDRGREVALQSDGKIVFAGTTCGPDGSSNCQIRISRMNSNGSADTTYATSGTFAGNYNYGSILTDLLVDASNRAVGVGNMTMGDGSTLAMAVRLTSNGAVDTSFAATGVRRYNVTNYSAVYGNSPGSVLLDGTGIVFSGTASNAGMSPTDYWFIARVQP